MSSKTLRYTGRAKGTIDRLRVKREDFIVITTSKTENVKTKSVNYLFAEQHLLLQTEQYATDPIF